MGQTHFKNPPGQAGDTGRVLDEVLRGLPVEMMMALRGGRSMAVNTTTMPARGTGDFADNLGGFWQNNGRGVANSTITPSGLKLSMTGPAADNDELVFGTEAMGVIKATNDWWFVTKFGIFNADGQYIAGGPFTQSGRNIWSNAQDGEVTATNSQGVYFYINETGSVTTEISSVTFVARENSNVVSTTIVLDTPVPESASVLGMEIALHLKGISSMDCYVNGQTATLDVSPVFEADQSTSIGLNMGVQNEGSSLLIWNIEDVLIAVAPNNL